MLDVKGVCVVCLWGCFGVKPSGKRMQEGPASDKQSQKALIANTAGNTQRHPKMLFNGLLKRVINYFTVTRFLSIIKDHQGLTSIFEPLFWSANICHFNFLAYHLCVSGLMSVLDTLKKSQNSWNDFCVFLFFAALPFFHSKDYKNNLIIECGVRGHSWVTWGLFISKMEGRCCMCLK